MSFANRFNFENHLFLNTHLNMVAGNDSLIVDLDDLRSLTPFVEAGLQQTNFIQSEVRELEDAIKMDPSDENRIRLIRDGIADTIVTVDGLVHRLYAHTPVTGRYTSFELARMADPTRLSPMEDGLEGEQRLLQQLNRAVDAFQMQAKLLELIPGRLPVDETAAPAEEIEELKQQAVNEAVSKLQNVIEILIDLTLTAHYGAICLGERYGFDPTADQLEVYRSNMTKFDRTVEEAEATRAKYEAMGVPTEIRESICGGETYLVTIVSETTHIGDRDFPKGKFLKSVKFENPVFA